MAFAPEAGLVPPVLTDGVLPDPVDDVSDECVILEFTVDIAGTPREIHTIYGSKPASELLTASLAKWKFRPARKDSAQAEASGRVRFDKGVGDEAVNLPLYDSPAVR